MQKGLFDEESELGKALTQWWKQLHGKEEFEGKPQTADRAELSRAQTLADVILLPSFQRSCMRFKPFFKAEDWDKSIERLAMILSLLARVRETTSEALPLQMASPSKGEKPVVSELRFRRLIQRDRDELYGAMIRILQKLGRKANIHALANDTYYWGDKVKREWAFSYFPNTTELNAS
ncbi:MAG: type I-E CRISPR-associated protein Cse2/CasB [Thiothrix sp.]|nr:MAG: type I-E CRISPR-associated protein Cse2/CasB [Thiothrix sp.]